MRRFAKSKYAFITYASHDLAKTAADRLNGKLLGTMNIRCNVTKAGRSLWIGNVIGITEKDLLAAFAPFGPIESSKVMLQNKCAFVNYKQVEDATEAKNQLEGTKLGDMEITINFKWDKSEKKLTQRTELRDRKRRGNSDSYRPVRREGAKSFYDHAPRYGPRRAYPYGAYPPPMLPIYPPYPPPMQMYVPASALYGTPPPAGRSARGRRPQIRDRERYDGAPRQSQSSRTHRREREYREDGYDNYDNYDDEYDGYEEDTYDRPPRKARRENGRGENYRPSRRGEW